LQSKQSNGNSSYSTFLEISQDIVVERGMEELEEREEG